jgi:hypothetical protein
LARELPKPVRLLQNLSDATSSLRSAPPLRERRAGRGYH